MPAMDASTLHCQSCGAAVGENDVKCPYCGSQLATLACPGCKAALVATAVGGVSLDQCHACGGVWVGQHNFEQIAGDRAERGQVLGALPGASPKMAVPLQEVHYRPCPQCHKLMNRTNYAHISGVVLDVCKDHGLWFDRDKLRQVLEFVESGGLERSHLRQVQDEDERRRLAAAGATIVPGAWDQADAASAPGEGIMSTIGTLFHMLK